MRILNDLFDTVLCIAPEERLATLQIEAASAALVKRVNDRGDFFKGHVAVTTTRDLAVSAAEVTFVGEHQTTNERDSLAQDMVTHHVLNAVSDRLHDQPQLQWR